MGKVVLTKLQFVQLPSAVIKNVRVETFKTINVLPYTSFYILTIHTCPVKVRKKKNL